MTLTADQIDSFNQYQVSGVFHPFTCGTQERHAGVPMEIELMAWADGLHCPCCDYVQDWAHDFMLDWSWKIAAEQISGIYPTP